MAPVVLLGSLVPTKTGFNVPLSPRGVFTPVTPNYMTQTCVYAHFALILTIIDKVLKYFYLVII